MTLEKDRKVRYQNAADIRTDLLRLKHDKGLTTVSAREGKQGRDANRRDSWAFSCHGVLYCRNPTALRFTIEKTILAVAGAGWLRPSLCRRSFCSVSAVSLPVAGELLFRRAATGHVTMLHTLTCLNPRLSVSNWMLLILKSPRLR
jgi:hypothetical protein